LTFCHRNPVRNDARGCAPSIARDARVFRFCKQPLDFSGKVRDEPDPPWILRQAYAQKWSEDSAHCCCFTPVGGRRREKKVAHSQRSMFGLNRGGPTQHPGRRLRGYPSSTVKIDCVLR
jgi:hypothetical protein